MRFLVEVTVVAVDLFVLWWWRRQFCIRPGKRKMSWLMARHAVRYVSTDPVGADGKVHLHRSSGFEAQLTTFNRPAVYFFVDQPGFWRKAQNKVQSYACEVQIPISSLDIEHILYRADDRVIAYLGDYHGDGIVKQDTVPVTPIRTKVFFWLAITKSIFWVLATLFMFMNTLVAFGVNASISVDITVCVFLFVTGVLLVRSSLDRRRRQKEAKTEENIEK